MKILVSDNLSLEGLHILQRAEGIQLSYQPGLPPERLLQEIVDADALIVRSGTHVTAELLDAAARLRVVGRAGFGVENIDMAAATRKGVVVFNTPLGNATTTAEHTIALLLALARRIPQACRSVRDGSWNKEAFVGVEISGKTLGVIGAGKIGSQVMERALGLKMRVMVFDPYLPPAVVQKLGAEPAGLGRLLAESDFVSLHVPLTAETENLLNEDTLLQLKPGCHVINCAQGGLVDELALAGAIRRGQVAGAALDSFLKEPPAPDNPLLQLEQVIVTPHIRAASADAQANVAVQVSRQVLDFLQRGIVLSALNVPSVSGEMLPALRPYLELADRLGGFMAQFCPRAISEVAIDYCGAVTDLDTVSISRSLLKGLLAPVVGPSVNYVNAPLVAKDRGISVTESRTKACQGFANLVRVRVKGGERECSIGGTVFGEQHFRIVQVDDFWVEAIPRGELLLVHNQDVPGVVGFLGQSLAAAGINIASMDLARHAIHGRVAALITVDTPVPEAVLATLRSHGDIFDVTPIHLP